MGFNSGFEGLNSNKPLDNIWQEVNICSVNGKQMITEGKVNPPQGENGIVMRFESLMFSANQKNKEWTAITQSVSDEMGYEVLCCQQTPAIFRSSVVFL